MTKKKLSGLLTRLSLPLCLLLTTTLAQPLTAGEALTLRVNDARARPGKVAALVMRTYQSQDISQGQVCMRSPVPGDGGLPFSGFMGAKVFSEQNDAVLQMSLELVDGAPAMVLNFESLSASINRSDGPLAVIYFRVRADLAPDTRIDMLVDPGNSFLLDPDGTPIQLSPEPGELRVLGGDDLYQVSASAEATPPGGIALLSMQTAGPLPLSGGQVGLRYDPAIADGTPIVSIDARYGNASFEVDNSEPGLVFVSFDSPDGTLNRVPGDVVSVHLPTRADIEPGFMSPVSLDPALTYLVRRDGVFVPIELEADLLVFE